MIEHPNGKTTKATPRQRCEYCGEPYVPTHHRQKYCCSAHANKARYPTTGWWTDHGLRGQEYAERSARNAQRSVLRPVEIRRVRAEDGRRYYARDADALLEEISDAEQARPGLLYG